jgi:hypothetical protein
VTLIPIGGNSRKGPVISYGGGVTEEKFFVGKNVPDPTKKSQKIIYLTSNINLKINTHP